MGRRWVRRENNWDTQTIMVGILENLACEPIKEHIKRVGYRKSSNDEYV